MKKGLKIVVILVIVCLIIGLSIWGYFLYKEYEMNKLIGRIENIVEKMYELDGVDSYKVKNIKTGLYNGKTYNDTVITSYDIKNKKLKFDSKDTAYSCNENDCKPILVESIEYAIFNDTTEVTYSYEVEEEGWGKYTYDISDFTLVDFNEMSVVSFLRNIKNVKIITETDSVQKYEVVIAKDGMAENSFYYYDEIVKDAVFKIEIKNNYIVRIETNTSDWYNDSLMSDYKDLKDVYEIYDINNSEVIIPSDIVNSAKAMN